MSSEIDMLIEQVAMEKGLPKELVVEALEESIVTTIKKKGGNDRVLEAHYVPEEGQFEIYQFKTVVEELSNEATEISLDDAKEFDPNAEEGDEIGFKLKEVDKQELGRIGIQTVKQVFFQKLNEAKRYRIFAKFNEMKNQIVQGTIRRFEKEGIVVEVGGYETLLPKEEQVRGESYRLGDQLMVYIYNVSLKDKGKPQSNHYRRSTEKSRHFIVSVSRRSPELVRRLFERSVPEISEGIVKIWSIARDPGVRTKVSVYSLDPNVEPVGSCVGVKGSRVQSIIQELRNEKIDIIPYSDDPVTFICNALAPATITRVIMNAKKKSVEVVVPDDQLSLAIGRRAQNSRLASMLTGWDIKVISESELNSLNERAIKELNMIEGIGDDSIDLLIKHGLRSLSQISELHTEDLKAIIPSKTDEEVKSIIKKAIELSERTRESIKEGIEVIDDLQ